MEENIMSEQLKKYVKEWDEWMNEKDSYRRDKELFDLQRTIRFLYEKEKDFLSLQEMEEVNQIITCDIEIFL